MMFGTGEFRHDNFGTLFQNFNQLRHGLTLEHGAEVKARVSDGILGPFFQFLSFF